MVVIVPAWLGHGRHRPGGRGRTGPSTGERYRGERISMNFIFE
jgi:hypothetical protein